MGARGLGARERDARAVGLAELDDHAIVRGRVEGGEVVESTVLHAEQAVFFCTDAAAVCSDLGIVGPANVQFKGSKIIEVNARFGGGCLLSINAGLPLVAMALGHKVDGPPWSIAGGMTMRRYHAESYR